MTLLHIAILTHNALEYTQQCLTSLAEHTRIPHHIFIVDNASTDDTPAWLSQQTSANLHLVLSRSNLGVPRGRNLLLEQIMPRLPKDAFIVFLDNDITVFADWYEPYLEIFAGYPCAGIAGATGHQIIVHAESRELLPSPVGEPEQVDVVSGFCFWIRAETMYAVGLFDEKLGMFWHEDDDYCIRAINRGYNVFVVPNTPIVHYGHKPGVSEAEIQQGGSLENQRYLVDKWRRLGVVDAKGQIIHSGH
jgi:GT2 family glycosyltransferase